MDSSSMDFSGIYSQSLVSGAAPVSVRNMPPASPACAGEVRGFPSGKGKVAVMRFLSFQESLQR